MSEHCPPLTAETDVKIVGNSATSVTNPSAHQSGGSPSPSSSPPLSMSGLGPQAIPRRHAPAEALARQGSFRGFPALSQKTSPFKRQLSLRMNELPSTMQRKSDFPMKNTGESTIPTNCLCPRLFDTAHIIFKYSCLFRFTLIHRAAQSRMCYQSCFRNMLYIYIYCRLLIFSLLVE